MQSADLARQPAWPARLAGGNTRRHVRQVAILALLLLISSAIVYACGGTAFAAAYVMLVPIMIAASWYALPGGIVMAVAAGIPMALMPLDAHVGSTQTAANIVVRFAIYLLLGGLMGWLFHLRRQASLRHREAARTDPQSGLANQVALTIDLRRCLPGGTRERQAVGVMVVRLTDLSDVVEVMGLEAGDALVSTLGQRIGESIREADQAYRIGQDELALILRDVNQDDLERIGRRLTALGEESLSVQQVPVRLQLAVGSALAPDHKKTPMTLLREARIAVRAAVRHRHEHLPFSSDIDQYTTDSLALIARVKTALADGAFELHYQPKVRLADGQVCGCEGLIRWRGDDGRLIPPGQFMPKVENTSLIHPVTHFVVGEAAAFARQHADTGTISINLSVYNLFDERLHQMLAELAGPNGIAPERLEVELTESALIGDLDQAHRAIRRIRDLGIGVSLDDFGTGFASFEYLQHLPLTGLKIDRTFVAHLEESQRARNLMACLIEVGHVLELVVTAEGVETQQQARILRQLGCDQAQGFFYSPALPAAGYQAWCSHQAR